MKNKFIILLLMFLMIISLSAVSAADENITETLKEETTQKVPTSTNEKENEMFKTTKNQILNAPDDGTFTSLQEKINNAGDVLILENNYTNTDNFNSNGITISKSITIDGNGYTIDALNKGRIFTINANNVILKNIIFKNAQPQSGNGGAIQFTHSGTVDNCTFIKCISNNGGAIYSTNNEKITVSNSIFINCTTHDRYYSRGGAIFAETCTVDNCQFYNSFSADEGGALRLGNYSSVINSYFENCIGHFGGAISAKGIKIILNNNSFVNNSAKDGRRGKGMGAALNLEGNIQIMKCNFINNTAMYSGGAIEIYSNPRNVANFSIIDCYFFNNIAPNSTGGAISSGGHYGQIHIFNSSFIGHISRQGGAIDFQIANTSVSNSYFANNIAHDGGAINWMDDGGFMYNCTFINNTATDKYFNLGSFTSGGAIRIWLNTNVTANNCTFISNSAGRAGAISWMGRGIVINSSFINNHAYETDAGAIMGVDAIINCNFINNTALNGDAGAVSGYCAITNSNFDHNIAGNDGGAIRYSGLVSNCNFTNNKAISGNGGAIRFFNTLTNCYFINNSALNGEGGAIDGAAGTVDICNFISNVASKGGAISCGIYTTITNSNFTDNLGILNGGAIYLKNGSKDITINNAYFIGNNATQGSAIFIDDAKVNIKNSKFIYNQAHSTDIVIRSDGDRFIATFTGKDNILNAIWNNGNVSNVLINGVNPKLGAENSNNGQYVYQDTREFNQTIIVKVLDSNNNVVETETLKTDIYGDVEYTPLKKGTKIVFTHPNDVFYTEIESSANIPSLTVEKRPTNPKIYQGEDVEFEIIVKNNGNIPLTNIIITEDEFKGLTYKDYIKSSSWTYFLINGVNTWTLNHVLNPGETETLKVIFTAPDIGIYNNTIFANATNVKNNYAKASVEVISNLVLEKLTLTERVYENDTVEFLITVTNMANGAASNVFIEDSDFSKFLEFIGWASQNGNWIFDNNNMKWNLADDLQSGESASIIVKFKALHTGELRNNATAGINNQIIAYSYNTTEVLHHHNNNNTVGNGTHNNTNDDDITVIEDPDTPDDPDSPDDPGTPDDPTTPVDPDTPEDSKDRESKSTSHSSGYSDSHATGNPIIVLLLALLSLVLIRRRD